MRASTQRRQARNGREVAALQNALKFARASVTGRSLPTPERPGCFLYILLKRYARESFLLYPHNDVLHPIKVNSAASRTALPFFLFYLLMRFLNTRPRFLMFVTVSVCTSLLTLMLLTVFSSFRLPSPDAQNATAAFEARRETAT